MSSTWICILEFPNFSSMKSTLFQILLPVLPLAAFVFAKCQAPNTTPNLDALRARSATTAAMGTESEGHFLKGPRSGCTVWYKHTFSEDSVTWQGGCQNGFADGLGTLVGFTAGKETSRYIGEMKEGKPHGKGVFTYGGNRKLEGNFSQGEPLFLSHDCLQHLHKQVISETDRTGAYLGDNNLQQLYYHALVPEGKPKGAVVLLPGTWETTEHLLSSTQTLCELAYDNHLAVVALSINQRLTLTDTSLALMNAMIGDAVQRYDIPKEKLVIGGWSMGGLFSLRYAELSRQDPSKTVVRPAAVFSCDGPCDLENIYAMFQDKLKKFPDNTEAAYGIAEMERHCGGTPVQAQERYTYYSCYTHSDPEGGNAKYLLDIPVRIYDDVDVNWWMDNRGLDMYTMNALDQSAMILFLKENGNAKAAFINAYQKGYRLEGNRHPHSWSIVEPRDCIQWILECLHGS
jgi:pimeloyl-ACP methyl ester carboxylesterase